MKTTEIDEDQDVTPVSAVPALESISKAELDMQIVTAKQWPRSIRKFREECLQMATLDEEIASECIYAVPRGGRTVEGPSARLAEIVASAWGNCRAGARIVDEDQEFVTAQGMFFDLERNVAIQYEVRRRITDKKGRRYNADLISVTGNAACSIALRNAVFKGVPKAFWKGVYHAARECAIGNTETLANRRAKALEYFQKMGVTKEQVLARLDVKGEEDVTLEHLAALTGFKTAIRDGEATVDSVFTPQPVEAEGKTRAEQLDSALKQKGGKKPKKADDPEAVAARFKEIEESVDKLARKKKERPMKVLAQLEKAVGLPPTQWGLKECEAADEWLFKWHDEVPV